MLICIIYHINDKFYKFVANERNEKHNGFTTQLKL